MDLLIILQIPSVSDPFKFNNLQRTFALTSNFKVLFVVPYTAVIEQTKVPG